MNLVRIIILLCFSINVYAQGYVPKWSLKQKSSLENGLPSINSHNDYMQKLPLFTALVNKVSFVEVDIVKYNKKLFVAHELNLIQENRTFKQMYIKPLLEQLKQNNGFVYSDSSSFTFFVDIKSNAKSTLKLLVAQTERYPQLFSKSKVNIIITGNHPKPKNFTNYPDYILFDGKKEIEYSEKELNKIACISFDFREFTKWNGKGGLQDYEIVALSKQIKYAHNILNKPVRFWNVPNTKGLWRTFVNLKVDIVNVDKLYDCRNFYDLFSKSTYTEKNPHKAYHPTYVSDGKKTKIKNVILLIGDGMGFPQLNAGLFANRGELSITNIKNMGMIRTQSSDNFTTDSAASGTALATGNKTNNTSIGVASDGKKIENISEKLKKVNIKTAIITTDPIFGATPASFYAHQKSRNNTDAIISDLINSDIDVVIGGGMQYIKKDANTISELKKSGFEMIENTSEIKNVQGEKFSLILPDSDFPGINRGQSDILPKSVKETLKYLDKISNNGFFMMVEGAQIDVGGHWNDIAFLVEEVLDFDKAVAEALKFADKDGETLIIVVADHETGGLSILQGNIDLGMVEACFTDNDHSGVGVPLFAYGPFSHLFRGIMENTEINKIIESLLLNNNENEK
ncbi:alkaline phosphatase [Flavicella sp.]|uniref:alkaline phosphatase n=1 Tax=Flavicella sp. TaxID=2957742 RepID=UPI0030159A6C